MSCVAALIIGPVMFAAYYSGDPVPKMDALMAQTRDAVIDAGCDFIEAPQLGNKRQVKIVYYNWSKR